ncbi:hypothetical protein BH10ACT1_BH10ACT1_30520 [soil metagenome]
MNRPLLSGGLVLALAGLALTACDDVNTVARPTAPVVLTGSQVSSLVGTAPGRIVAFRHALVDGEPVWTQVPVQVDQRKVVAFGSQPAANGTAGVAGTVYGNGSGGPTSLVYADPNTFVGADTDPNLDADDEVVFMASDAGGKVRADDATQPAGVVAGSGVAVQLDDPRDDDEQGWVYLFASTGSLSPSAGKDYVKYTFSLTSGAYKTTYLRAAGPNPETSKVVTPTYEASFTDRWMETSWKVRASGASGVDVLDGAKSQFAPGTCGRSNVTFTQGEGAFVANIDGPVRAIRSYVGANSGPLTQRTHLMYRDREDVVTNLRVHAIPGVMDFVDLSTAAKGMTYRSSTVPGGVKVDGVADVVSTDLPTWESVDGPQGQLFSRSTFTSTVAGLAAGTRQFYRDATTPATNEPQCWGDGSFIGATGPAVQTEIPDTDPRNGVPATVTSTRVTQFAAPAADKAKIAAAAADWSADLAAPLVATVSRYQP